MHYYIQNVKENRHAPNMSWWKFNDLGYTSDVRQAKQFTVEQIKSMHSITTGDKRAWPCSYIDGLTVPSFFEINESRVLLEEAWSTHVST